MNTKKIKGFTLIELMVVVAIIAILAAIAIPAIFRYRIDANRAKCVGNMKQIQNAVEAVRIVSPSIAGVGYDNAIFTGDGQGSGYWKTAPTCPEGGVYNTQYDSPTWVPSCDKTNDPFYHRFENN